MTLEQLEMKVRGFQKSWRSLSVRDKQMAMSELTTLEKHILTLGPVGKPLAEEADALRAEIAGSLNQGA